MDSTPARISPLDPLKIPIYRAFWMAGLFSNIGTWMHETGAVWLMTDLEPRPEMVTAVRVAMTLPVFGLVLAAGVWADHFNRRNWLLGTQSFLLVIATVMWVCTTLGWMTPWALLLLTAGLGVASTLNLPAWQAMTPELVPTSMIPSAIQAGSVSFNLARSVGPALAGLAIAQWGVGITFLFNAISFLGTIFVLVFWKPAVAEELKKKKKVAFFDELRKGLFIARNSVNIRSALVRVLLFDLTASSLWSLLSLVATEKLGLRERGFGLCLAALGLGAVLAAGVLPWLRQRFSSERLVLASQIGLSVLMVILGQSRSTVVAAITLPLFGAAWMTVMTTLNATAQVYLPKKFRARGMSAFVMFFSLGMGMGAFTWGLLAKFSQVGSALTIAAVVMLTAAILTHRQTLGPLNIESQTIEDA
ncbi:MAG: MFS transporter [Pirellulales bacterium]